MRESELLNITILGASGFIGRNLTEYLEVKQKIRLKLFVRNKITSNNEVIVGDIKDEKKLVSAIKDANIVINLISNSFPGSTFDAPSNDLKNNIEPVLKVIELCKKYEVKQLIYISSGGAVYGVSNKIPLTEDENPIPISSYGVTKLAIEHYLRLATLTSSLNVCVLRVSNPYGKYQSITKGQGIIAKLAHNIMNDKEIIIWGDGGVIRDYISIQDVCHAIFLTINKVEGYQVYNIGSGKGRSINELLELFKKISPKGLKLKFQKNREIDVPINVLCTNKFKEKFDWKCNIELENEIDNLLEWYKDAE